MDYLFSAYPFFDCSFSDPNNCLTLDIDLNPSMIILRPSLLSSLERGHYKCCERILDTARNFYPEIFGTEEVIISLLKKDRSERVIPSLKLLLKFKFPVNTKRLSRLEFKDGIKFSEEVIDTLREHGFDVVSERFASTKSSNFST